MVLPSEQLQMKQRLAHFAIDIIGVKTKTGDFALALVKGASNRGAAEVPEGSEPFGQD